MHRSALKALQLTMQSPEPHRDVDIHDGEDQGALPCHGRGGAEQPKELPSMEMEVDETPEDQDAELGAAPGQGKGSPEPSSTALQLTMSQSPCPADHDTSPPEACEPTRVDIQAGEDQAPMPPGGEVVHLLDLPSVEFLVHKTSPEKMQALSAPQVLHSHLQLAALTA
jgi:hypothetical protein